MPMIDTTRFNELMFIKDTSALEEGVDVIVNLCFISTNDRNFWRLNWVDITSADPGAADFDRDGLTNPIELTTSRTNPLKAGTDSDLLLDRWEIDNGFDSLVAAPSNQDIDSDELADVLEQRLSTNPRSNYMVASGTSTLLNILAP